MPKTGLVMARRLLVVTAGPAQFHVELNLDNSVMLLEAESSQDSCWMGLEWFVESLRSLAVGFRSMSSFGGRVHADEKAASGLENVVANATMLLHRTTVKQLPVMRGWSEQVVARQ